MAITAYILFLGSLDTSNPLNVEQTFTEVFSAIAGNPHNTSHQIRSINSLFIIENTSYTNSTLYNITGSQTLQTTSLAAFNGIASIDHDPGIAPENIPCYINGHFLGYLSDNPQDNYTVTFNDMVEGTNTVTCG